MMKRVVAWAGGVLLLALVVASEPLERAAHQSSTASDVGGLVAVVAFGGVGVVVAVRQSRNVMGWILLGIPVCLVLNTDTSAYAAIDFRIHPGRLPLGQLAVQLQPSWAPGVVLLGWRSCCSLTRRCRRFSGADRWWPSSPWPRCG